MNDVSYYSKLLVYWSMLNIHARLVDYPIGALLSPRPFDAPHLDLVHDCLLRLRAPLQ